MSLLTERIRRAQPFLHLLSDTQLENLGTMHDSVYHRILEQYEPRKSTNAALGLPRDKMQKLVVAFDIDGTLRCNCTATCQDRNEDVVAFAEILKSWKNFKLIAWSGGGAEYVRSQIRIMKLDHLFSDERCYAKLNYYIKYGQVDVAVDDIQDTALGKINFIVRCK